MRQSNAPEVQQAWLFVVAGRDRSPHPGT